MSATAVDLIISTPTPTPESPDARTRAREVYLDVNELVVEQGNTGEDLDDVALAGTTSQEHPPNRVYDVEMDEHGMFVVTDIIGAVYGVGPTEDEALADFFTALAEHLRFLREHPDELHPRLQRQLAALENLFPDR